MGASEPLPLLPLTAADVAGGLALSDAARWNQTADDWRLFIEHGRAMGCRSPSGELIATAATLTYGGNLGWISMVLVAEGWRHRGLAVRLLDDAIKSLQAAQITPVLDATPAGAAVYRRLGFRAGFELERWEGPGGIDAGRVEGAAQARAATLDDLDAIAALDRSALGIGRGFLLQAFLQRPDARAWVAHDGRGFTIARGGRRATQSGALVCGVGAGALELLKAAWASLAGPVYLDVPVRWASVSAWLEQRGFVRQRPYTRMSLGSAAALTAGDRMFVLAGPEFG
jgi:ribosomal protein S18 acetylase RimI-like enzyme